MYSDAIKILETVQTMMLFLSIRYSDVIYHKYLSLFFFAFFFARLVDSNCKISRIVTVPLLNCEVIYLLHCRFGKDLPNLSRRMEILPAC